MPVILNQQREGPVPQDTPLVKRRYRVLVGKHIQKETLLSPDGSPVLDKAGKEVKVDVMYSGPTPDSPLGEEFESGFNMLEENGRPPMSPKFELVSGTVGALANVDFGRMSDEEILRTIRGLGKPQTTAPQVPQTPNVAFGAGPADVVAGAMPSQARNVSAPPSDEMSVFSVEELKQYAKDKGIKVEGLTKKHDLLKAIRDAEGE